MKLIDNTLKFITKELKKKSVVIIPEKRFKRLFGAVTLDKYNLFKKKLYQAAINTTWKYEDNYITFRKI